MTIIRARKSVGPRSGGPEVTPQKRVTVDTRNELVLGFRGGMSVLELSRKYKLHRSSVGLILDRAGLVRTPMAAKLDSTAVEVAKNLYLDGLSLANVAQRFDVDASTIARSLRQAGVELRKRRGWPVDRTSTTTRP